MTDIDELLLELSSCPPGDHAQIDDAITPMLKALIGQSAKDQSTGLKVILDECACCGLASDFAMIAMDGVWKMAIDKDKEGKVA